MPHVLDNPAWEALNTFQAHLSEGGTLARRYGAHLAPIAAVGRRDADAIAELAALVPPGDWISMPATLEGLVPLLHPPLKLRFTKTLVQMVQSARDALEGVPYAGDRSVPDARCLRLGADDVAEMVELARITQPGPFRTGTYSFGTFLGIRVEGRLAAMGGQRMHLPGYREVSAICTHPDFRGRGYARLIVARLVELIVEEGLTPFLHVEEANLGAQALYTSLGFTERARLPLVVLERPEL